MSVEKRQKWWTAPLGHFVWLLLTLACSTLRKRVVDESPAGSPAAGDYQCIAALWHNRIFVPCYFYRYVIKGKTRMSMLTSASKDGAMLATVAKNYRMRAVRGSSNRRGAAGFKDMLDELKDGCSMCITPDGPKGPIYKCHPGVIKLASMSGLPLVPVRIQYHSYWRIRKAWDAFIIPKPFSRVTLFWGVPMHVPAELTDEQMQEYRQRLDRAMAGGTPDFDELKELN